MLLNLEYILIAILIVIALTNKPGNTFRLAISGSIILFAAGAILLTVSMQNPPSADMTGIYVGVGLYVIAFVLSVIAFFNKNTQSKQE